VWEQDACRDESVGAKAGKRSGQLKLKIRLVGNALFGSIEKYKTEHGERNRIKVCGNGVQDQNITFFH
jgi:hypothetical protein